VANSSVDARHCSVLYICKYFATEPQQGSKEGQGAGVEIEAAILAAGVAPSDPTPMPTATETDAMVKKTKILTIFIVGS
jgi:hypothetical protein